jgi:hypothetical protein
VNYLKNLYLCIGKLNRRLNLARPSLRSYFLLLLTNAILGFSETALAVISNHYKKLAALKLMKSTRQDRSALIIGNGPSAKKLDVACVIAEQRKGLEIYVVNYYATSRLAESIVPNYYVLSDPLTLTTEGTGNQHILDFLNKWPQIFILVPSDVPARHLEYISNPERVIFFNNRRKITPSKNIDPTKAHSYVSMTTYKAIAIAVYLQYKKIYIIGIDNSMFKGIESDLNGNLIETSSHFYDKSPKKTRVSNQYVDGISAYLRDAAQIFDSLEMFKKAPIENLDSRSLISQFPKNQKGYLVKQSWIHSDNI